MGEPRNSITGMMVGKCTGKQRKLSTSERPSMTSGRPISDADAVGEETEKEKGVHTKISHHRKKTRSPCNAEDQDGSDKAWGGNR
eukprot:3151258-Rhodomonas_salina.2